MGVRIDEKWKRIRDAIESNPKTEAEVFSIAGLAFQEFPAVFAELERLRHGGSCDPCDGTASKVREVKADALCIPEGATLHVERAVFRAILRLCPGEVISHGPCGADPSEALYAGRHLVPVDAVENRIAALVIANDPENRGGWIIRLWKQFAAEYGGGVQAFAQRSSHIHGALYVAREMVTLTPGRRGQ